MGSMTASTFDESKVRRQSGRFADQVHDEATGVELGAGTGDWERMLSPGQRSALTRAGIHADEWAATARLIEASGHVDHTTLLAAKERGFAPHQAEALAGACGSDVGFYAAPAPDALDEGFIRSIPASLRPVPARSIAALAATTADLEDVAAARPHAVLTSDVDRVRRAIELAEQGIDAEAAKRTGSGDDWHRAGLCRAAGLDDVQAKLWAPHYPVTIEQFRTGGWDPVDVASDTGRLASWARDGQTKAVCDKWTAAGFDHVHTVRGFIAAGVSPADAARWEELATGRPLNSDIAHFAEAGIDVDQATAARDAGLAISYSSPAVIASTTPEEIGRWADAITRPIQPDTITAWRSAGVDDPARAKAWMAASQQLPTSVRKDVGSPAVLRFINRHVEPADAPTFSHPIIPATARELGIYEDALAAQAAKAKGGPVEACRSAFRRRKVEVPF
jgi:hypothetical protein